MYHNMSEGILYIAHNTTNYKTLNVSFCNRASCLRYPILLLYVINTSVVLQVSQTLILQQCLHVGGFITTSAVMVI